MGEIVAARLGIDDGDIEWVETVSDNREPFLQNGTVDIVIASYSITDERRAVVGQAGPYYVTGQQLLVREDDEETITGPDDLANVKVCSVEGSTSLETVEKEYGAKPVPFATYSECVEQLENETVDVVTTDGAILLGYAAQKPDELEVVGEPFSEERYGIGYSVGRRGHVRVPQRDHRGLVRGRHLGRGIRGDAGRVRRGDARAPDARPLRVTI